MAAKKSSGKDSPGNAPGGGRRYRRSSDSAARWDTADAESLRDLIHRASVAGGAVRFGTSRDGGAYSIGVYGDGEPYTEWVSCREDINEVLDELATVFEAIAEELVNPPF